MTAFDPDLRAICEREYSRAAAFRRLSASSRVPAEAFSEAADEGFVRPSSRLRPTSDSRLRAVSYQD